MVVSRVKESVEVVELYIFRGTALMLAGDKVTLGATPKAPLKVTVAMVVPVALPQLVPVITVMVPALSLPTMDTVGVVQAAVPAAIVGVVPPVMM